MTRWHNHYLDNHAHFCTAVVLNWRPALTGPGADALLEAWESVRTCLDVKVLAYVVMPEHFHLLSWSASGQQIRRFLQRTLSVTAKRLGSGGMFWKERPRVLPVYSSYALRQKVDYIHRNPIRRGLVADPEAWGLSSYRQLTSGEVSTRFVCDEWAGFSI
jgi:putative transposase